MDVGTSPERLGYTTDAAGEIDVARDAVYARQSELQSNLKWLRENDPLRWTRPDGYRPFWFGVETHSCPKCPHCRRLPRPIKVLRPSLHLIPKLDVAASTPVARSLFRSVLNIL
jgi:hypothetical protein